MQVDGECTFLLDPRRKKDCRSEGLSTLFAVICILDIFGVFPIISLPKALIDCGYYGIVLILIVCSTQIYTAALLGRCWVIAEDIFPTINRRNRQPYAVLAEITLGKTVSSIVTFLLDLTVFGGGIPNLIVAEMETQYYVNIIILSEVMFGVFKLFQSLLSIASIIEHLKTREIEERTDLIASQNLQLLGLRISDGQTNISFCYWILITGMALCPLLWLGSPKDMKCICFTSTGIVTSVFILTISCLLSSSKSTIVTAPSENMDSPFPWQLLLKAYGIITFQFDIHPSILTIQVDMHDKTKLTKALLGGFLTTLSMSATITIIAAFKYGVTTQPSILETLPTMIPLHLAAILVAVQLCLTSAVSNNALYQHMEDCMQISRDFNIKRCILRTTLTILAILIAESVPEFDLVMSLIGGALVAPFAFILPPIIFLKMKSLRTKYCDDITMSSVTNVVVSEEETFAEESIYRYMREDLDSTVAEWPKTSTQHFFEEYLENEYIEHNFAKGSSDNLPNVDFKKIQAFYLMNNMFTRS